MKYSILAMSVVATTVLGNAHHNGICAKNIKYHHPGGTGLSPGQGPANYDYDQLIVATENACKAYAAQRGGSFDCTDCTFRDFSCHSDTKRLGGKEWHRYCLAQTTDPSGRPTGTIVDDQ